jgi:hypothetical protein
LNSEIREVVDQFEQRIFVGDLADVGQPFGRYSVGEQFVAGDTGKEQLFGLDVDRDDDFLNGFTHFDQLGRACFGMALDFALLGLANEARFGAVDDEPNITGRVLPARLYDPSDPG